MKKKEKTKIFNEINIKSTLVFIESSSSIIFQVVETTGWLNCIETEAMRTVDFLQNPYVTIHFGVF